MKKIYVLTIASVFCAGSIFAQKNVVKDANRALKSGDLTEASTLIKQALENPETANDPEAWKILGDIGNKAFDDERTKEMLQKPNDKDAMYNGLMESYAPYVKADELGQAAGKNKVRKDIMGILKANHPFFINGGIYFNDKKELEKASQFFEVYWNIPTLPMFQGSKDFNLDSTYQTIKYYSIITAIQDKKHDRAISLIKRAISEPFIANSAYKESDLYELLASEYLSAGDSAQYITCLNEGAAKFPQSKYFIPNLINSYIQKGENAKALAYLDKAIANDPSNACDLNSVKAAIFVDKKDYNTAQAEYNKALKADPNCERALEGLGVSYILQAQEIREQNTTDRAKMLANDKAAVEFYQKSLPLLEKYRSLLEARKDDQLINSLLMKLRNVYYNLSNLGVDKAAQLKEVEGKLGL